MKNKWFFWSVIVTAIIIASIPLLHSGFFHFSDEPHIANLYQMFKALQNGQFPPRWATDMSWHYGYPLFNFYYPLPYYLGSIFYLFTHSLILSLKFTFLITIPLSFFFMFFFLRKHTDKWASLLGAVVYIFTPYRAVDLYVRGALGELWAFVFFPLLALLVFRIFEKRKTRDVGFLGLATGLFLLSHNLAPLFFLPFLFCYALVLAYKNKSWKTLVKTSGGILMGAGISAYFIFPAFLEKNLLINQTPFNFSDHFPFIQQLIYSPFRYGASNPGPYDDISFQLGIINWIILISIIFLVKKINKSNRLLYGLFLISIIFSLFLMNIRSSFLWNLFTLSTYVQFPWRILMFTTFFTSSLVIFLGVIKKYRVYIFLFVTFVCVLLNFSYFRPSEYYNPDDNYFLTRFFPGSKEYYNYSEDYLILPKVVEKRPDGLPTQKFTSAEVSIKDIKEISSTDYSANVIGPGIVEFHSYYFPGWYATVDGVEVKTFPISPTGDIGLKIEKGNYKIRVSWKETPFRKITDVISIISFMITLVLIFKWKKE